MTILIPCALDWSALNSTQKRELRAVALDFVAAAQESSGGVREIIRDIYDARERALFAIIGREGSADFDEIKSHLALEDLLDGRVSATAVLAPHQNASSLECLLISGIHAFVRAENAESQNDAEGMKRFGRPDIVRANIILLCEHIEKYSVKLNNWIIEQSLEKSKLDDELRSRIQQALHRPSAPAVAASTLEFVLGG